MADIEVALSVTCKCGSTLNYKIDRERNGDYTLTVDPCDDCLEAAADKGRDEGRKEAEE